MCEQQRPKLSYTSAQSDQSLHEETLGPLLPGAVAQSDAWYADGHRLDPHIRLHSFVEFGNEIISMAILSIPLFQEGQLSVTGERLYT